MKGITWTMIGVAALFIGIGTAWAQTRSALLSVSGRGTPGWTLSCSVERLNGAKVELSVRGRSDARETITRNAIRGADCSFSASDRGPLELTVDATQFLCPFSVAEGEPCTRAVAPGERGQFTLGLRTRG